MENIEGLIFATKSGSIAYSTSDKNSDIDIRGIFVANEESIRTPFLKYNDTIKGSGDVVYHELNKFMYMLLEGNPNILELLWVDDINHIFRSDEYLQLRQYRSSFLSKRCVSKFKGFANSERKRINEKLEPLSRKYNKAVYHYYRLIKMVHEILTDGYVYVDRRGIDSELLVEIKNTTEQTLIDTVLKKVDKMVCELDKIEYTSTLRQEPDYGLAKNLIIHIQNSQWRRTCVNPY